MIFRSRTHADAAQPSGNESRNESGARGHERRGHLRGAPRPPGRRGRDLARIWLLFAGAGLALAALYWSLIGLCVAPTGTPHQWTLHDLQLELPREFTQKLQTSVAETSARSASRSRQPLWQPLSSEVARTVFVHSNPSDPVSRVPAPSVEVIIDRRPGFGNAAAALTLIQQLTYGRWYRVVRANYAFLGGHQWLRHELHYQVDEETFISSQRRVVEYALVRSNKLYRVIFRDWDSASDSHIEDIMNASRLVSEDRRDTGESEFRAGRPDKLPDKLPEKLPDSLIDTLVDNLLVIAVGHVHRQRLHLASGGSGTVISPDGAFLSNLHVVFDEERGQLYDVFFVGRWRSDRETLEFVCAGRPGAGEFAEDADLALLRCDSDLWPESPQMKSWTAVTGIAAVPPEPGSRVVILGFPDANAGHPAATTGILTGWAHRPGSRWRYLQTDAGISAGVSGGGAFSADGRLLGVPTAYRFRAVREDWQSDVTIDRVGLIQPLEGAQRLLQLAANGWAIERNPRTR